MKIYKSDDVFRRIRNRRSGEPHIFEDSEYTIPVTGFISANAHFFDVYAQNGRLHNEYGKAIPDTGQYFLDGKEIR